MHYSTHLQHGNCWYDNLNIQKKDNTPINDNNIKKCRWNLTKQ